MRLRSIVNAGQFTKIAIGINVYQVEGKMVYSYCVIKFNPKDTIILGRASLILSIDDLKKEIEAFNKAGVRVHVNFFSKAVLTKASLERGSNTLEHHVKALFPFLPANEIVAQRYIGNEQFYSVLKNNQLEIMNELGGKDYTVHSFSLGPFVLDALLPVLAKGVYSSGDMSFSLEESSVAIDAQAITEPRDFNASIANQNLSTSECMAFASALLIFRKNSKLHATRMPARFEEGKQKCKDLLRIYQAGKIALITVFVFLSINTVARLYLTSVNDELKTEISSSLGVNNQKTQKNEQFSHLISTYSSLGWEENILPIYYADQLAQTIGVGMKLTKLEAGFPDEARSRSERKQIFKTGQIEVSGLVDAPIVLTRWIAQVDSLNWVVRITSREYVHDEKLNKGKFKVSIEANAQN